MQRQLQLFAPYRCRRAGRIRAEKVRCIANYELKTAEGIFSNTKPWGGIWTSTYTPHLSACSDWLRFCEEGHPDFIPAFGYLYKPIAKLAIYTICTCEDVDELLLRYGGRFRGGVDFEALGRDYDAIQLAVNTPELLRHPTLAYWDSECTLWFAAGSLSYLGRIRLHRNSVPPHPVEL